MCKKGVKQQWGSDITHQQTVKAYFTHKNKKKHFIFFPDSQKHPWTCAHWNTHLTYHHSPATWQSDSSCSGGELLLFSVHSPLTFCHFSLSDSISAPEYRCRLQSFSFIFFFSSSPTATCGLWSNQHSKQSIAGMENETQHSALWQQQEPGCCSLLYLDLLHVAPNSCKFSLSITPSNSQKN